MRRVVFLLGVFALSACSGGGVATPAPPQGPCAPNVTDTQAKLISPPAGATGVSPTIGSITFSYGLEESASTVFYQLTANDGSPPIQLGDYPVHDDVVVISPGVASLAIPPLKSATTYSVTGFNINMVHIVCFRSVTVKLGSFTTS